MSFIVLGAGAVGGVVGTLLERAGHDVWYWARANKPRRPARIDLQRVDRPHEPVAHSRPLQWLDPSSRPLPDTTWIFICVRTEQLMAALRDVALHLGPERAVAIATVTLDGAVHAARAAGLRGPVLALHVAFGSGQVAHDPGQLAWFPFSVPSTVSADGQRDQYQAARALARVLSAAGLPTSSTLDMADAMRFMVMSNIALLPSWELCHWDIAKLGRDPELRALTARAMQQTTRAFPAKRGFARALALALPLASYTFVLRILPWLMGTRARKLWLVHGPKVSHQTGFILQELLDRAARANLQLDALAQLHERWRTMQGGGDAALGPAALSSQS